MTSRSGRAPALLTLTMTAALTLAACGGGDGRGATDGATDVATEDEGGGGGPSFTMLPKNLGNAYFDTSTAGAAEAAAELDGALAEVGPETAGPDAQVPYIDAAAQGGAGGLVLSANDPTAVCDAVARARGAGVKVVTFDSDTGPGCRDLFVNQATPEGIAATQLELIAEQIGGSGRIAILSASANATNQNVWIEMIEAELGSNTDYADIELVDTVYGDDEDQRSFDQTEALLRDHPDLEGIISPTTVGIAAAARYLQGSPSSGDVALTGLGTPNEMRPYVEDGTVTSFALWNPADLGYLATYAAAALVDGTITGAEGDTFEAGRLGDYTVEADGVVVLGEPFVFDAENIADFDF